MQSDREYHAHEHVRATAVTADGRTDYCATYPSLAAAHPDIIEAFEAFDQDRLVFGAEALREPPLVPDRIKARHPMAN